MPSTSFELMHNHVRAIHRALTGQDLKDDPVTSAPPSPPSEDEVVRRFAELELLARRLPSVAERVPPFSFSPPLDVLQTERELIVDVGVPGVQLDDVVVHLSGDLLSISGALGGESGVEGRSYYRAELPRGPFRRSVRLPQPVFGEPRVEVERGVIRIRMAKVVRAAAARA